MKGILTSVGYDDILAVTLPRNRKHFDECLVVTSLDDHRTVELAKSHDCQVLQTNAFTRHGAKFNKGAALEEGFDCLGRDGWILIHDADILFPDNLNLPELKIGNLYNLPRRILEHPQGWIPSTVESDWTMFPFRGGWDNLELAGYFQLFHASDPVIRNVRPWYTTDFIHAGRADSDFQKHWQGATRIQTQTAVLHLGPCFTNWFGRVSDRLDGLEDPNRYQAQQDSLQYAAAMGWTNVIQKPENYSEKIRLDGVHPARQQ